MLLLTFARDQYTQESLSQQKPVREPQVLELLISRNPLNVNYQKEGKKTSMVKVCIRFVRILVRIMKM